MYNDLSPLVDGENSLNLITTEIPNDILYNLKGVDIKVYGQYLRIATGHAGVPVDLPPREELAEACGISINTLHGSEKRLHERGWITITNLNQNGKNVRYRVIVKTVVQEVVTQIVNRMHIMELYRKVTGVVENGVDIICNPPTSEFPPSLRNLITSSKKADRHGRTFSHFSEAAILAKCHNAPASQIEFAILECESYKKPVGNLLSLFGSRFIIGPDDHGTLNPERDSRLGIPQKRSDTKLRGVNTPFRPDEYHTPALIDAFANDLNAGKPVERGQLPLKALTESGSALVADPDIPNHVRLHRFARLVKVEKGFWRVQWEKQANVPPPPGWSKLQEGPPRAKSARSTPTPIGDTLNKLVSGKSSS